MDRADQEPRPEAEPAEPTPVSAVMWRPPPKGWILAALLIAAAIACLVVAQRAAPEDAPRLLTAAASCAGIGVVGGALAWFARRPRRVEIGPEGVRWSVEGRAQLVRWEEMGPLRTTRLLQVQRGGPAHIALVLVIAPEGAPPPGFGISVHGRFAVTPQRCRVIGLEEPAHQGRFDRLEAAVHACCGGRDELPMPRSKLFE